MKAARDADFADRTADGRLLNSVRSFGTLGGATLDNEENYLIKKLFGGGLGSWPSKIRRGYDTAPRCPVWAPRSAAARLPRINRTSPISDCILFMGSNMAEAHPVGFRWPMKAKERGATLIHVDPRFTRTSALCDVYVGIRAGSDVAFLGGLVNYVLSHDRWFGVC